MLQRLARLSLGSAGALGAIAPSASHAAARRARASDGVLSSPSPLAIPLALEAPADVDPQGHLVSEKLDGVRAVWDGRQLRFRSGLPVAAPAWFLARLPAQPLDGELWMGRGRFEALSGAVRRSTPQDAEWRTIQYMLFDVPASRQPFAARARELVTLTRAVNWPALQAIEQRRVADRAALTRWLDEVVRGGGEGLVLRAADAGYGAGRSLAMLKLKPLADAEATVIAHETGQGRLAGRLGALLVQTDDGLRFRIGTGFDDAQRVRPPVVGSRITFTYRGRTDAGVPRFASFLRERPGGV